MRRQLTLQQILFEEIYVSISVGCDGEAHKSKLVEILYQSIVASRPMTSVCYEVERGY